MPTLNLNKAEFLKSAVSPSGFLTADLPCIVFAGKSNVGKSSVINRLLGRKNFARVGAAPGKTIHINYFLIDGASTWWTCQDMATPRCPRVNETGGRG